jgi:hypothetical protein
MGQPAAELAPKPGAVSTAEEGADAAASGLTV